MTPRSSTLSELYRHARTRLGDAGVETPEFDARLLLEDIVGMAYSDLIARPDMHVEPAKAAAFEAALERRVAGEPVHRILGHRDFWGMRLRLSAETLEPRPDTETLVEATLPLLRDRQAGGVASRILDLGTGTGAIALALLRELPTATVIGVDVSADALATARANAVDHGLAQRFEARRSDWFSAVTEKFHAIVANPPYIPSEAVQALSREVREHDPRRALDGGADGLDAYRVIATQSANHLERDGIVAVEIGYDQFDSVSRLFSGAGFALKKTGMDLSGRVRVLVFSKA
ncbi:MAG: peptide chain release factor N(5)-glutamine methyltransferase [Hyphomicrobiales bacterium]|jgi:release factor glutamine methyltransferase|nr:peptide chain release factor N(5)-glutamine methyltransferase [Hyphomicrobiales bacterium]